MSESEMAPATGCGVPAGIVKLNAEMRLCRRCEEAGFLAAARPVVYDGGRLQGLMLIGQAPGVVEFENRIPFGGRAGRELFRWMASIGIEETDFRDRVYMGAVTRCFPGKNPKGSGDRKPSRPEMELCRPWLEAALDTVRPRALILVGTLAIDLYLPRMSLEQIVGKQFERDGITLIPLPHPSGASRWLNDTAHRGLLKEGLERVRYIWNEIAIN